MTGKNLLFGNNSHLIYSGSITDADAKRLTQAMTALGLGKAKGATILYTRNQDGSVVSVVVKDGAWEDPTLKHAFPFWAG